MVAPLFVVDAEFADAVAKHSWCRHSRGYLASSVGGKLVLLHRFVWGLAHGSCPRLIDHINRLKYDCRISNLRPATNSLNGLNSRGKGAKLAKGVWRNNSSNGPKPFCAAIQHRRKTIYLGSYPSVSDASAAYQAANFMLSLVESVLSGECK